MLRAIRRTTPAARCAAQQRRAFFGLDNFSFTNSPHEPETQSYREQKVLPYVTVHQSSGLLTQICADTGAVICTKSLRMWSHIQISCHIVLVRGSLKARCRRTE